LRDWGLRWDMNYDGSFTISDVWALLHSLFFYPGDWIIAHWLINSAFGNFFEFSKTDFGGVFSMLISTLLWGILLLLLWLLLYALIIASEEPDDMEGGRYT